MTSSAKTDHSKRRIASILLFFGTLAGCASDGSTSPGDASAEAQPNAVVPDSASTKRAVGAACNNGSQCEGTVCLEEFRVLETVNYIMKNGYCSMPCSREGEAYSCPEGLSCLEARPNLDEVKHYCFKECTTVADCRQSEGYECATGNVCFPKDPR